MMRVPEHDHPLKLIDLQVNNEDLEESEEEEEEEDLVTQDEFACTCKRCGREINEYYRYYYKCIDDSCDYSLHNFCAELPTTLKHTSDPHPLTFNNGGGWDWRCSYCESEHKAYEVFYKCHYCYFVLDIKCCVEADKKRIYHPSHPHPLVSLISHPILCLCKACGKVHKGVFFQCTTCSDFVIHIDCAFQPKSLLIQNTTNGIFHHTHPLTLSYSFPWVDQLAKCEPHCRVCDGSLFGDYLWIYKCEKCLYYAHLDCATSRREPFMSILSIGKGPTIKNFEDADHPDLLYLPFPDPTYSIPKHLFFNGPKVDNVSLQHIHQHGLILVDTEWIDASTSLNMCHNPLKKIQLLCNGCVRPITEMPFYKCGADDDESCNFALHEWCTRLPTQVDNHPGHPQHTLHLMSNVPRAFFNIFYCAVCHLPCNGYAYGCIQCNYYVDATCGFMPKKITHKSHPGHLLSVVKKHNDTRYKTCHMCHYVMDYDLIYGSRGDWLSFSCNICDVYIHPKCALLLQETIRHTYDKHPMHLRYLPAENHKSEYFCEICENELNPHRGFYHCDVCAQSMHSACAPLILCSETETCSEYGTPIYLYLNVKFGSIHKTNSHPHPLSFAQGIADDGQCNICSKELRFEMIFKCDKCRYAIHYKCCKRLNNS